MYSSISLGGGTALCELGGMVGFRISFNCPKGQDLPLMVRRTMNQPTKLRWTVCPSPIFGFWVSGRRMSGVGYKSGLEKNWSVIDYTATVLPVEEACAW